MGLEIKTASGKKSKKEKPDRLTIKSPMKKVTKKVSKTVDEVSAGLTAQAKTSATKAFKKLVKSLEDVEGFAGVTVEMNARVESPLVDEMIELKQELENLGGELSSYKSDLLEDVTSKRQESLDAKSFVKTVDVEGNFAKIQVQFQDRYSPLAAEMEKPLRDIFDGSFDTMFSVFTTQTLKPGKMEELKQKLGDSFDAYFETTTTVNPNRDFQERYFTLSGGLNEEQKETVQKVLDACQSTPAVKFPK